MGGPWPRLKIAFVGQQEYYHCIYGCALDDLYEVRKYQMVWGAPWYYYADLVEFDPDVVFFFRPELYPDELLRRLSGVRVALSSEPLPYYSGSRLVSHPDTAGRWESLRNAHGKYDSFWHFNSASLRFLREQGFDVDGEFVFPVDTGLYRPLKVEKKWDAIFFGRSTPWRERYLGPLKRDFKVLHIAHGVVGEDLVYMINASRIAINIHVDRYLTWEHRVQNMMACEVLVMSEPLTPNPILRPNQDYVEFRDCREFWDKFLYYIHNRGEAEMIARSGRERVRAHLDARKVFPPFIEQILQTFGRTRNARHEGQAADTNIRDVARL